MKLLTALGVLMLLPFLSLGQSGTSVVPTVIVTTYGDTVRALTEPVDTYGSTLTYWMQGAEKPRIYGMNEVRSLWAGNRFFEQVPFGNKTFLMEAASTGVIRLFAYRRLPDGQPQSSKPGTLAEDIRYRLFYGAQDFDIDASNAREVLLGLKVQTIEAAVSRPEYKYSELQGLIKAFNNQVRAERARRTITGRVLDADSRKPVRDALIEMSPSLPTTKTNVLGFFQLNVDSIKVITITHPEYEASAVELPNVQQFTTLVKPKRVVLPWMANLKRFEGEPLEDSVVRARLDSLLPSIHYTGGWRSFYQEMETGLQRLGWIRANPKEPIVIQFAVDARGDAREVQIFGGTDSVAYLVKKVVTGPGHWKVEPSEVGTWRFEISDAPPFLDEVYTVVEESARPVGGMQAFYREVGEALNYPPLARRNRVEGRVFVEFVIEKDGRLTNVKAIQGPGSGLNEEAVRVVSMAKNWLPGMQRGKPVKQRYTLPIIFKLDIGGGGSRSDASFSSKKEATDIYQWLAQNISYPAEARRMGIEGSVLLRFKVLNDGRLDSTEVLHDIGAGVGAEVLRALRATPASVAMTIVPKNRRVIIPINFGLDVSNPRRFPELEVGSFVMKSIDIVATGVEREVRSGGMSTGSTRITLINSREGDFTTALINQRVIKVRQVMSGMTSFPDYIGKLQHVRVIDVENNQITSVPAEIGLLVKLEELFLPNNQVKELPQAFASLQSLKVLALANNKFTVFPEQVLALPKLAAIDLAGNNIKTIPPSIGLMTKLEALFLQDNKLETLPEEIFQMPKLKILYLAGNPISEQEKRRILERMKKVDVRF